MTSCTIYDTCVMYDLRYLGHVRCTVPGSMHDVSPGLQSDQEDRSLSCFHERTWWWVKLVAVVMPFKKFLVCCDPRSDLPTWTPARRKPPVPDVGPCLS